MGVYYPVPVYMGKYWGVFSPWALADAHFVEILSALLLPSHSFLALELGTCCPPAYPPRGLNLEVVVWAVEDEITAFLTQCHQRN